METKQGMTVVSIVCQTQDCRHVPAIILVVVEDDNDSVTTRTKIGHLDSDDLIVRWSKTEKHSNNDYTLYIQEITRSAIYELNNSGRDVLRNGLAEALAKFVTFIVHGDNMHFDDYYLRRVTD